MEVVAGVHKVDGTIGSNVYLLVDDRSLALVDTGLQGNAGKIGRYIEGLGRKVSDLRWIILTHSHPDHTGSIRALRMHSDLKVLVHRDDVRWDQDGRPRGSTTSASPWLWSGTCPSSRRFLLTRW